jgi:hypothetical protein
MRCVVVILRSIDQGFVAAGRARCSPKECGEGSTVEHDAESREPVFGKDHAQIEDLAGSKNASKNATAPAAFRGRPRRG